MSESLVRRAIEHGGGDLVRARASLHGLPTDLVLEFFTRAWWPHKLREAIEILDNDTARKYPGPARQRVDKIEEDLVKEVAVAARTSHRGGWQLTRPFCRCS